MSQPLADLIAERLDATTDDVRDVLDAIIERIQQQVTHYGYARLSGLGTFRSQDGAMTFEPEPELAAAVNHRYADLEELDMGAPEPPAPEAPAPALPPEEEIAPDHEAASFQDPEADAPAADAPFAEEPFADDAPAFDPTDPFAALPSSEEDDSFWEDPQPSDVDHPLGPGTEPPFEEADFSVLQDRADDFAGLPDLTASDDDETPFEGGAAFDDEPAFDASPAGSPFAAPTDDSPFQLPTDDPYDADDAFATPSDSPFADPPDAGVEDDAAHDDAWPDPAFDADDALFETPDTPFSFPTPDEGTPPADDAWSTEGFEEAPQGAAFADDDYADSPDDPFAWTPDDPDTFEMSSEATPDADAWQEERNPEDTAAFPWAPDVWDRAYEEEDAGEGPPEEAPPAPRAARKDPQRPAVTPPPVIGPPGQQQPLQRGPSRRGGGVPKPILWGAVVVVALLALAWVYFFVWNAAETPAVTENRPPVVLADSTAAGTTAADTTAAAVTPPPASEPEPSTPLRSPDPIDPSAGGWTIVVASETSRAAAESVAERFRAQGWRTGVLTGTSGGTTRYRVGLGQLPDQASANAERTRLAGDVIAEDAWVLRIR